MSPATLRMNLTAISVIVHKQPYIMAVVWHAIFCPAEKSILASISLSCTCCHVIRAIHFLHLTTYLIFLTSSVCEVWASSSISSATRPCSTSARNFSRPDNMNGQPKCRGSASAGADEVRSVVYTNLVKVREKVKSMTSQSQYVTRKFGQVYHLEKHVYKILQNLVKGGVWVTWWYTPSVIVFETYIDQSNDAGRMVQHRHISSHLTSTFVFCFLVGLAAFWY